MICALLGQDIRLAFTGPLVLWFIFCFTDFFRNKLVLEDKIKIKIKFILTIFQLN